jgi:hypothetical protein
LFATNSTSIPEDLEEGLAEKKGLNDGSSERNHSKTAVNNLAFLALGDKVGILALELASIKSIVTGFAFTVVLVKGSHLRSANNKEDLQVSAKANRSGGTKDVGIGELVARDVNASLLDQDANNGKHAHASVLEFGPTSVFQVSLDIRPVNETEREDVLVCCLARGVGK